MGERDDFCKVRLSAKGEELAGDGVMWICGGKYEFCFRPGFALEVSRGEWNEILSKEMRDGEPLLEIVENEDEKSID